MAALTDSFDLAGLRMSSGEARRLELAVSVDPFALAGEAYTVSPSPVPVTLEISRTTGPGYALRLRLETGLEGPCMRCLIDASPRFTVDVWEISQPGSGDELESPYVEEGTLALRDWARDALALALPAQILCEPGCAGLCPECGINLNQAGPEHAHERAPDPRWAKLAELRWDR